MAITAITPASGSNLEHADSAAFTIDDTYTSLVIKAQTASALVVVYSTALGGGQPGYTVSVQDNGDGTHTVTYEADSGWDIHPQQIYVVEDETGSEATTNITYNLAGENPYPQGEYPYNATGGVVVNSFNGRTGVVVPAAGDYDAFYYTEAESDALFATYLPLVGGEMSGNITMAGTETVDGRDVSVDGTKLDTVETNADVTDTANVTAAGALMDSEVDADIKTLALPANTTISAYGATVIDDADAATARATLDAARAMLSGAGVPGFSTGDGYPLGTTYADTTNDVGYILVDATGGANVWHSGSGAVYLSGAGTPGGSTGDGESIGTTYIDTTADEAYFLTDNTGGANVWSTVTGSGGGGGSGDVVGPAGATDDRIATFDGTTGKLIQEAPVGIEQSTGIMTNVGTSATLVLAETVGLAPSNSAGYGKLWVDNTVPTSLMFTDDVSTDHPVPMAPTSVTDNRIATWDGTTGHFLQSSAIAISDNGAITMTGTDNKLEMVERSSAPAHSATYGKWWVANTIPCTPRFTKDDGADAYLLHTGAATVAQRLPIYSGVSGETTVDSNLGFYNGGSQDILYIDSPGMLRMGEQGTGANVNAAQGGYWVRSTTASAPAFRDDTNTDHYIPIAAATPTDNYLLTWDGTTGRVDSTDPATLGGGQDYNIKLTYDTSTLDSDPGGPGGIRFNNATPTSATEIYVDNQSADGLGIMEILGYLQSATNIILWTDGDSTKHIRARVDRTENNSGTYATLYCSSIVASTSWATPANGTTLYMTYHSATVNADYMAMQEQSSYTGPSGLAVGEYSGIYFKDDNPSRVKYVDGDGTEFYMLPDDGKIAQDAVLFTERADHVNTFPSGGFSEFWVKNDAPTTPMFTDDDGTDFTFPRISAGITVDGILTAGAGTDGVYTPESSLRYTSGRLRLTSASSVIEIGDRTSAPTPVANTGSIWVLNDNPTTLYFTDEDGTDLRLGGAFTHNYAGGVVPANTTDWYGPNNYYTYYQGTNWTLSYGAGTDPAPAVYSMYPVAPRAGIIRDVQLWVRGSNTAIAGEVALYKFAQTDGSGTLTATKLNSAGISIPTITSTSQRYDASTTFTTANTVAAGDMICPFIKLSAGATNTLMFTITYVVEYT